MNISRALIAGLLLAAIAAGTASAGDVRLVARDEPVRANSIRSPARAAPLRFDMVGLHWRGSGTVTFRTRSLAGVWSAWRPARPEAEDLPDRGTSEAAARPGWKLGNAYWTGPANSIQYRLGGEVTRLRAFFIWSDPDDRPVRAPARAGQPAIISRAQWGADESIVRAAPSYADRVRFAVVHHTAGTNSYSASESAAIVRGIERYHVIANGWNDIGYNFLVDKYGQVFEGRGGGIDKNVVGAHAQGFNTGSTGVSVLGTYEAVGISTAARTALVKLLAWRLDVAHVDPSSKLTWISAGNPKYPAGTAVRLRAVSGHRDTGPTSCPGGALYAQLPAIISAIAARGLPKLYDPEVSGALGGAVHVTGRLSAALPWIVTITDQGGGTVASGSGSGTSVDWTWNAASTPFGTFSYTISADPDVRPWTARVPGPPPLAVRRLAAAPQALTPNGDGAGESTTISFWLTTAASVTAEVVNGSGSVVRRLASSRSFPAGKVSLAWDARDGGGQLVPDGHYSVEISAVSPGQSASSAREIVVDRTLGNLALVPGVFSPNGDGRFDTAAVTFDLTRIATVRVLIMRGSTRIATLVSGTLGAHSQSFAWNGRDASGIRASQGSYTARVEATTSLGTRVLARGVRLDTTRPVVKILSATFHVRTKVTVTLSEPARLTMWFGPVGWWNGDTISVELPAGTRSVYRNGRYGGVRIIAMDVAGNRSGAVTAKVRRT
jgi:flagellar hook assembly protein FlgD